MPMTRLEKDFSLKKHNTFHLDVHAKFFVEVHSKEDLIEALNIPEARENKIFILGDGANVLFKSDFNGLIIKNSIKGIRTIEENDDHVILEVGSGVDWHELVTYTVNNNLQGIENLAFIPGTVGAAPVQNIAAYGQELAETFETLTAISIETGEEKVFTKEECEFKYRDSIFKGELKDKYFITQVRLKLSKHFKGVDTTYHSRYESLESELQSIATLPYKLKDIYNAVISIRKKKLPQVEEIGTIGSTFANPFITQEQLKELQKIVPHVQFYPINKMLYPKMDDPALIGLEVVKVPAGWLLEEMGYKGVRDGNVGTFPRHALCVVAYDGARGEEVYAFTEKMRGDFKKKYGITLKYEVNVI
ncbi:MAG: UDP-N-acetylenolpyruvoylglucosamine reductase [Candidatus Nomurabacteria bacterium]|nr:UDP-N-acetylenolpyruvoylglucosamine reductase [Candidatus Nomurabacteria bacterium]